MSFARIPNDQRLEQLKHEFDFTCTNCYCIDHPNVISNITEPLNGLSLDSLPDVIGFGLCYWDQEIARCAYFKMIKYLKKNYTKLPASEFLYKQKQAFLHLEFSARPWSPFRSIPSPP